LYLPKFSRVKNQGRTKEEPRNDLRTPKLKRYCLLRKPLLHWFSARRYSAEHSPLPAKGVQSHEVTQPALRAHNLGKADLHHTLYTLHKKNHPTKRFFLLNSKLFTTFAVAKVNQSPLPSLTDVKQEKKLKNQKNHKKINFFRQTDKF